MAVGERHWSGFPVHLGGRKLLFTILATLVLVPLYLAFKALGAVGEWLWEILRPVFQWIGEKAVWLWDAAIKPSFKRMGEQFDALGSAVRYLWDQYIRPVFQWIAEKAMWLYNEGVKPSMDRLRTLLDLVSSAFDGTKDNIKRAWDQIKEITKAPVKFVVDTVYNGGIVPVWNAIAGITGVGKLNKVEGFHTGGIMSGYSPGRDDRVIAVGGGEAVMRPEWTHAVGADRINAWNAAARSGGIGGVQRAISAGMPAYANGGIVDWFSGAASKVGSVLKGGWDALSDPGALFDELTGGIKNKLRPYLSGNPWASAAAQMPVEFLKDLKAKALELFTGGDGEASGRSP